MVRSSQAGDRHSRNKSKETWKSLINMARVQGTQMAGRQEKRMQHNELERGKPKAVRRLE